MLEKAKNEELISVIVPAFNATKYIGKCLDSLLMQTYGNLEIIVVNDGSSDNILDLVSSYKDSRIIVLNQQNQGQSAARNNGLKIAKG